MGKARPAARLLRDARLPATDARCAVIDVLETCTSATHADICLRVEEHAHDPKTIWRTLWTTERAGVVERISAPCGPLRWRWRLRR